MVIANFVRKHLKIEKPLHCTYEWIHNSRLSSRQALKDNRLSGCHPTKASSKGNNNAVTRNLFKSLSNRLEEKQTNRLPAVAVHKLPASEHRCCLQISLECGTIYLFSWPETYDRYLRRSTIYYMTHIFEAAPFVTLSHAQFVGS